MVGSFAKLFFVIVSWLLGGASANRRKVLRRRAVVGGRETGCCLVYAREAAIKTWSYISLVLLWTDLSSFPRCASPAGK
eukprot:629115-Pyramimonas_sp.AAC.1